MKGPSIILLLITLSSAHFVPERFNADEENIQAKPSQIYGDQIFIDSVGDIGAVLGPQGKNIIVCEHGDVIAVIYGAPSGDPNNSMQAQIAYSLNAGTSWSLYGPFSGPCRRLYAGVDGPSDFCQVGGLIFVWQKTTQGYNDSHIEVMIEENIPSAPSFSIPCGLPNSQPPVMYPWFPSVAVAQDNADYVVLTAWSYLAGGNGWAYCWISHDGGHTWTDTIPMAHITGDCGHIRQGTDGYVFYTYHDYYNFTPTDSTLYPYYIESTDGGYTWGPETPIPGVPVNSGSMFWWHEFDCEIVNNTPWAIHTDIGTSDGSTYIMHGTGSPGNWTWEIWDAGELGTCSLTIADTTFCCYPSQYPNLTYDPVSNTVLASYKAHYYKEHNGTILYDGAHIGGIYTTANGANWAITEPLSTPNTGQVAFDDWSATEVAHRLVSIEGDIWSYAIWVDGTALALYFERGLVTSFLPLAINESNEGSILHTRLNVTPSISKGRSSIEFSLSQPTEVEINLYDISGRFIYNILEDNLTVGYHSVDLPTHNLPHGIYFVSLQTECVTLTKKVILVR